MFMLKKLFSSIVILLASLSSEASGQLEMPQEFYIKQHWLSWTTSFDVETRQQKFGTIHRRFLSLTVEYDFYDIFDQFQANARMRIFSFGAVFDVTDNVGHNLGTINQHIFTFFPTFDIVAPNGQILAVAKMNFWGTTYNFKDPMTDQVFAQMYRPFFRFKDDWTVTLLDRNLFNHKQIDPRLFIIVAAFQTDRDFWYAEANRDRNEHKGLQSTSLACKNMNVDLVSRAKTVMSLRQNLENYRANLQGIEPSESDVESIDQFIETYLSEQNGHLHANEDRLCKGISLLLPALDGNDLTPNQKSALFLMIDKALEQLK